jgi:hypothetical protein
MTITSTGIYGTSSTIVTSDLYEDIEQLKTNVTTLTASHLSVATNDDGRLDILEDDNTSNKDRLGDLKTDNWWGGERDVGGVLPRINIGADVWGESSIMTGVYERWCSSTLHIGWGLCDRLCLVLVCRDRYGLGGVFLHLILGSSLGGVGPVWEGGRGGWCEEWARSG